MAKGLRASSRKKNNAALRHRIFGPASDARTARLSAKLQELAAKPRPDQERKMDVDTDETKQAQTKKRQRTPDSDNDDMDVDSDMDSDMEFSKMKNSKRRAKKQKAGRIQKRTMKKKAKAQVVFPDKWKKVKEARKRTTLS